MRPACSRVLLLVVVFMLVVVRAGIRPTAAFAQDEVSRFIEMLAGRNSAAIDLPAVPVASDVIVGTGWFDEDFVVGRVSDYQDFRVWEIT